MRVPVEQIRGARLTTVGTHEDVRGHFVKIHERDTAGEHLQLCSSYNARRGTIRGLHLQLEPYAETKLVWCLQGALYDVVVDLRPGEPTYGHWGSVPLDAPGTALVVPPGVAHGYQTTADATTVVYLIEGVHSPRHARTLRWDDPAIAVEWPEAVTVISDPDREAPAWTPGS